MDEIARNSPGTLFQITSFLTIISYQRKVNYPRNYRYGLDLKTNRKFLHVVLCILLAGDIATSPGPGFSPSNNRTVRCLAISARSLISVRGTNNCQRNCSNLERFQNLVYTEVSDIVCVSETWLRDDINNAKILHLGCTIFRNDRKSRGGGVLLGRKVIFL